MTPEPLATLSSSPILPSDLAADLAACTRHGVELGARLAPHTSFRIGGPAAALLTINRLDHLITALDLLYRNDTPFMILGGGSNVLISDAGVPAVVILNQCRQIRWPAENGAQVPVEVESGAPLAGFARETIKRGLAGMAWAVSVPGAIGGAVVGNAGAHGGAIADTLDSADVWSGGEIKRVAAADLQLHYRHSAVKKQVAKPALGPVVLSAAFMLAPARDDAEQKRAEDFIAHRRRTQPVDKSAGSIFRNPPGDFAGRLLEAAAVKGVRIGGASVSEQHANFIVNQDDARADDVIALMNFMRRAVFERFGVILEPEIQLIGDWQGRARLDPLPP